MKNGRTSLSAPVRTAPMLTNSRHMSMRVMLAITTLIPCRVSSREMNNDVRGLWLLI